MKKKKKLGKMNTQNKNKKLQELELNQKKLKTEQSGKMKISREGAKELLRF